MGMEVELHALLTLHSMYVGGQRHTPATLSAGMQSHVPVGLEACYAL
jgi:hypothetical protein